MLDLVKEIKRLKEEKDAVILAHCYQRDEVQEIADYVGDSLYLSQIAQKTDKKIIVFCGVHFMAETAKILNPEKKVLLPVMSAGCRMADMISANKLLEYKNEHPNTKIICYVNTTAEVKALSDCVCTSTNAMKIITYYANQNADILYVPDKNLGTYAGDLLNKKIEVWPGFCPIHNFVRKDELLSQKKAHPNALLICHPECTKEVVNICDYVGSTKQLVEFTEKSDANEFIVATERGVFYEMKKRNPGKKFYLASRILTCPNMKKTHLLDVYNVLNNETNEIFVDDNIRVKAKVALDKMMELTK